MSYSFLHRGITRIAIAALLVSPLIATIPLAHAQDSAPTTSTQPSLLVTGTGIATYKPDTAYVSLGVVTRGKEVAVIAQENAAKTDRIIKALVKMGIAVADIRTDDYNVGPAYENKNGNTVMNGYKVSNTVTAIVRKVANAGKTIDIALKAGANTVSGVSFGIDNSQKIEDEALANAIADATRKARLSAKAAGLGTIRLIELVVGSVNEYQAPGYAGLGRNSYSGEPSTPIQGGRQTMTAMVTVRFGVVESTPVIVP